MTDSAKEKPSEGEIIAAGNGKIVESGDVRPLDVKVGDKVFGAVSAQSCAFGELARVATGAFETGDAALLTGAEQGMVPAHARAEGPTAVPTKPSASATSARPMPPLQFMS